MARHRFRPHTLFLGFFLFFKKKFFWLVLPQLKKSKFSKMERSEGKGNVNIEDVEEALSKVGIKLHKLREDSVRSKNHFGFIKLAPCDIPDTAPRNRELPCRSEVWADAQPVELELKDSDRDGALTESNQNSKKLNQKFGKRGAIVTNGDRNSVMSTGGVASGEESTSTGRSWKLKQVRFSP